QRVGEAEEQDVVHRPLAEVMVDPKDRLLVKAAEQRAVERLRRREVTAEGLLDDDASAGSAAGFAELLHDQPEHRGRNREIVRRTLRGTELLAYALERRRVSVVPVDVAQQATERIEPTGIESAMLLDAVARAGAKLVQAPSCLGDADQRHVEVTALRHRLHGGKDLLVAEIARGAEECESIRLYVAHPAAT